MCVCGGAYNRPVGRKYRHMKVRQNTSTYKGEVSRACHFEAMVSRTFLRIIAAVGGIGVQISTAYYPLEAERVHAKGVRIFSFGDVVIPGSITNDRSAAPDVYLRPASEVDLVLDS